MKKSSFLLIVLMCMFSEYALSQTVTYKTINYIDDADYTHVFTEKYGSRVGLKIDDVNKKLVDINKDIKQTSFNTEVPSLFETFFKATLPQASAPAAGFTPGNVKFLSPENIDNSGLDQAAKKELTALNELYISTANTILSSEKSLRALAEVYKDMKRVLQYQSDLLLLQSNCSKKFDDLMGDVNALTKTSFSGSNMAAPDRFLLDNLNYTTNKAVLNRYLSAIADNSTKYYDEVSLAFSPSKKDEVNKNIANIYTKIDALIQRLDVVKPKGDDLKALLSLLKEEKEKQVLKNKLNDLLQVYTDVSVTKLHSDMEAFNSSGKKELFAVYDYFTRSNWVYYVDPQNIDNDLTVITVNISPKSDVPCSPVPRSYELRIRARSGLKVDFSTGLFTNFGGHKFMDQSYRYETIDGSPDDQRIVRNKSKNAIFPSVGALMHFYKRSGKDVNLAGTFGISTKDLDKINYHLGGSLILGHSQRVILSFGTTLTKATLISDKYEEGQIIPKAGSPGEIPTSAFNRFGYFIGLTYNLSSK